VILRPFAAATATQSKLLQNSQISESYPRDLQNIVDSQPLFGRDAFIYKKLTAGSLFAHNHDGSTTVQGGRSLVAAAEEVILVLVGLPPLSARS